MGITVATWATKQWRRQWQVSHGGRGRGGARKGGEGARACPGASADELILSSPRAPVVVAVASIARRARVDGRWRALPPCAGERRTKGCGRWAGLALCTRSPVQQVVLSPFPFSFSVLYFALLFSNYLS